MTVCVAGAGGCIGGWLVKSLLDDGEEVLAVDIKPLEDWYLSRMNGVPDHAGLYAASDSDLRDPAVARAALSFASTAHNGQTGVVTQVYNLACDMGGMGFIESHKAACMLSVLINTNLLEASRQAGSVEKYFFSSSACVYNADHQAVTTNGGLEESMAYPAQPEDGYGWEKLFSERMCRHYMEDYGLETRVARYHNVFGTHGTWRGGREKVPAALCRKVAESVLTGGSVIDVWGDGQQTRSFLHVDDCVRGTRMLMDSDVRVPVNIGSERLVSINALLVMIERIAGTKLEVRYDLSAPQGVRGRCSDNRFVNRALSWAPLVTLEEGLEELYGWVLGELRRESGEVPVSEPERSAQEARDQARAREERRSGESSQDDPSARMLRAYGDGES